MSYSDDLLTLIDAIYAAAFEPHEWPAVIKAVAERIGGSGGALHVAALSGSAFSFGANWNVDPLCLELYEKHYFAVNPLTRPLLKQPAGAVVGDHMLVAPKEMKKTEIYNDFFSRYDITGSATSILSNSASHIGAFAILRNTAEVFRKRELRLLETLTPHLIRAATMNQRLERVSHERSSFVGTLDMLEAAVLLLDSSGQVRHMNSAGESLTRLADGLTIYKRRLTAAIPEEHMRLSRAVSQALLDCGVAGSDVLISRPSGRSKFYARICPLPRAKQGESNASAVVFVSDPDRHGLSGIDVVLSSHRLTPAEAAVVNALVEGNSLREISGKFEVTISTVRNQLKRAMAKTDTHRQADLVRLVMSSRLPLAGK